MNNLTLKSQNFIALIVTLLMFATDVLGFNTDKNFANKEYFVESPYSTLTNPTYFYKTANGFVVFEKGRITYQKVKAIEKEDDPVLKGYSIPKKFQVDNTSIVFVGSNNDCSIQHEDVSLFPVNYFLGELKSEVKTKQAYSSILMKSVYNGIDIKYYFQEGKLKYDIIAKANSNLSDIKMQVEGDSKFSLVNDQQIRLNNFNSPIEDKISYSYQVVDGVNQNVQVKFNLKSDLIGFVAVDWNKKSNLIIDPSLIFSTYVGGSDDDYEYTGGISKDTSGNIVVTGRSLSTNFPTTAGSYLTVANGYLDCVVFKLNPIGNALEFATYIGGNNADAGYTSLVNPNTDEIFIGGSTRSSNFPSVSPAYQTSYGGGGYDGFVLKLNNSGSTLLQSSFVGNSYDDLINSICFDNNFDIVFVGQTKGNFINTGSGYQVNFIGGTWDLFVGRISQSLNVLTEASMLGGYQEDHAHAVKVDSSGNVYVMGITGGDFPTTANCYDNSYNGALWDVFCAKFKWNLTQLIYSTYVGSSGQDWAWNSMDVDFNGNMFVTGYTNANDFPITPGVYQPFYAGGYDIFVFKLNSTGTALLYSTYFGSNGDDQGWGIDIQGESPIITGYTELGLPIQLCSYAQTSTGIQDAFVLKFDSTFTNIEYSNCFGGTDYDCGVNILVDGYDCTIAGITNSTDFSTSANCYDNTANGGEDFFVLKYQFDSLPPTAQFISDTIVCINDSVQFNNLTLNGQNYLWDFGDNTNSTLYEPKHLYTQPGSYFVVLIVDNCLGVDVIYKSIEVVSVPSATFNYQINCNREVLLSADSISQNYYWDFGGLGSSLNDTAQFAFANSDSVFVTLITSNSFSCADTLSQLVVSNIPVASYSTIIDSCTMDIQILPDQTVSNSIYNWTIAGSVIQNTGQPINLNLDSIFDFTIQLIVSANGCSDTLIQNYHLDSLPKAQFTTNVNCDNSVQFTNTSTNFQTSNWYFGNGDSSSIDNPNYTYSTSGNYLVSLITTSNAGCVDTTSQQINIPVPINYQIVSILDSCSGEFSFQISPAITSLNSVWDFGDGTVLQNPNFTHTYQQAGNYNLTIVVDSAGICPDTIHSIINAVDVTQFYPVAQFNSNINCDNSVQFTNTSTNYQTSNWYFGNGDSSSVANPNYTYTTSGNYLVSLITTSSTGCIDTTSQQINIPIPINYQIVSILDSCSGEFSFQISPAIFSLNSVWDFGDGTVLQNPNFTHTYQQAGNYNLTIIVDSAGICPDTIHSFVNAVDVEQFYPVAQFTSNINCDNSVQFNNTSTNYQASNWYFGNGDSSSVANPYYNYTTSGNYLVSLIATSSAGCIDTISQFVNIQPDITYQLASALDSCSGEYLFQISPSISSLNSVWDFGDGIVLQNPNFTHTYQQAGNYNLTVVINPGDACPDTLKSILYVVDFTPDLKDVPNIFTPNNDGVNDRFEITNKSFCKYLGYTIFNRWGQELFHTTNIRESWDGKQNGYDLPEGVYVIVLHGEKPASTFLTIIR